MGGCVAEMTGVLAHALPRVCQLVGAAAGGHEQVDKTEKREKKEEREKEEWEKEEREKEQRQAASHALELVHEIHRKVNVGAGSRADVSYTRLFKTYRILEPRLYLSPLVVLD